MIASRYRFHGRGGLRFLHVNAHSERSHYFILKTIPVPQRPYSRFAVIVSKKVHKSAVGRNRIRRRVYELMRNEFAEMSSSHDIAVVIVSGETMNAPQEELRTTLRELGIQASLLKV